LAIDCGIDQHACAIQHRSVLQLGVVDAGQVQPLRPILARIEMQQRNLQQVRPLRLAAVPSKQSRAADREELLIGQADGVQPHPTTVAVANREIDILFREVDVMHRCRNPEVDFAMALGESAQAMYQPLGGEVR